MIVGDCTRSVAQGISAQCCRAGTRTIHVQRAPALHLPCMCNARLQRTLCACAPHACGACAVLACTEGAPKILGHAAGCSCLPDTPPLFPLPSRVQGPPAQLMCACRLVCTYLLVCACHLVCAYLLVYVCLPACVCVLACLCVCACLLVYACLPACVCLPYCVLACSCVPAYLCALTCDYTWSESVRLTATRMPFSILPLEELHVLAQAHPWLSTRAYFCAHTCAHARACTHSHAHTHTRARTHTLTHRHTHA